MDGQRLTLSACRGSSSSDNEPEAVTTGLATMAKTLVGQGKDRVRLLGKTPLLPGGKGPDRGSILPRTPRFGCWQRCTPTAAVHRIRNASLHLQCFYVVPGGGVGDAEAF